VERRHHRPANDRPAATHPGTSLAWTRRPAAITTGTVVTFRNADEPRPLAARFIAVANRHRHGWRVHLADGSVLHTVTFDAAADAVSAATGVPRLLIHWPAPT
jgi:hypothetical protein